MTILITKDYKCTNSLKKNDDVAEQFQRTLCYSIAIN